MWAELTIHTRYDLPSALAEALRHRFDPPSDPRAVLQKTEFRGNDDVVEQVVFAKRTHSTVFPVFRQDARTLKVHVELLNPGSHRRELKVVAEELTDRFADFVRFHRKKLEMAIIQIYAEGEQLETGRKRGWWERIADSSSKDALGKVYVPVATFVASVLLDYEVRKAIFNAVASLAAMAVWVVARATLQKSEFTYE